MMQVVDNAAGNRRYFLNDLLAQNSYNPVQHVSTSLFSHVLEGLIQGYTDDTHDALCIGMGVGALPMWLAESGSKVDVVEINPTVVPIAERYFDFHPERVNLQIGDGRYFLYATAKKYNLIVLDAFLGESPPSHLMTRETFQAIQRRLKPGGLLVMNTFGDFEPGKDFMASSIDETLRTVFRNVTVHGANGSAYFAASDRELKMSKMPDFDAVPGELRGLVHTAFDQIRTTNPADGLVLTDDYNPADYRDAAHREELRRRLTASLRAD
jgi:SAM-dependent methyltransferase